MQHFTTREEALAYLNAFVPFGVAAGVCRDAKLAGKFAQAGATMVGYGSVTPDPQDQNPGDNFYFDEETGDAVNAWGIGNSGARGHLADIVAAKEAVNEHGSKLWVSGSVGKAADISDYFKIARILQEEGAADIAEANYSCGNMRLASGKFKPTICDDPYAFDEAVAAFSEGAGELETAAKLGPTTSQEVVERNVAICLKYGVRYIIMSNTIPNCYIEKPDGTQAITMRRGGLSGRGLIPIVTSMLQMAAPLVDGTQTRLIAAGGINCGADAYKYMRHGAHGFVMCTAFWRANFDPKVIPDIIVGDPSRNLVGLADLLCTENSTH